MIFTLLIILIDYIFLLYASSRLYVNKLQGFIVSKLVYMSAFSPVLLNIFGMVTNIGTVIYGSVMVAQCIIMKKYGLQTAVKVLQTALYILFMMVLTGLALSTLPILAGNEVFALATKDLLVFSPQSIFGSFCAFIISQNLLVFTFKKLKLNFALKSFIAILLAQVVDSLIFFSIAFYNIPNWASIMLDGFILKVCLTVIFLPILYLIEYDKV